MKRIWQISASLVFTALLAQQALAQGYGPRNWKAYTPATTASADVSDSEPEAAKVNAAKVTDASENQSAAYYAQIEAPPPAPGLLQDNLPPVPTPDPFVDDPPGASASLSDSIGCSTPICNDCQLQSGCGNVCDACCPTRNFARIEYLMWWGRGRYAPPLVTTSFDGTLPADAGVLPNATVLFGDDDLGTDLRSGARLTVSRLLDADGCWMAVGRFYGLGDSTETYHAESAAGSPILARPFINFLIGQEDSLLVAYPGFLENGVIDVESRSDMLGAETYVRHIWACEDNWQIDFLGGYQFSRLDDSLMIQSSAFVIDDPRGLFPPDSQVEVRDSFRTRNEFHGGVVGLAADIYRGPWKFEMLGKVGFGNQRQTVTIDGNTLLTPNGGAPTPSPVGLLARQTNIGTYQRDVFTFIPEVNFTLGYQIDRWNFSVGYSFLYWNDVAWAGDQIDLNVNLGFPGVPDPLPAFAFRNTDFWLQGISFGAEYTF